MRLRWENETSTRSISFEAVLQLDPPPRRVQADGAAATGACGHGGGRVAGEPLEAAVVACRDHRSVDGGVEASSAPLACGEREAHHLEELGACVEGARAVQRAQLRLRQEAREDPLEAVQLDLRRVESRGVLGPALEQKLDGDAIASSWRRASAAPGIFAIGVTSSSRCPSSSRGAAARRQRSEPRRPERAPERRRSRRRGWCARGCGGRCSSGRARGARRLRPALPRRGRCRARGS